jgi:hypothetical protein
MAAATTTSVWDNLPSAADGTSSRAASGGDGSLEALFGGVSSNVKSGLDAFGQQWGSLMDKPEVSELRAKAEHASGEWLSNLGRGIHSMREGVKDLIEEKKPALKALGTRLQERWQSPGEDDGGGPAQAGERPPYQPLYHAGQHVAPPVHYPGQEQARAGDGRAAALMAEEEEGATQLAIALSLSSAQAVQPQSVPPPQSDPSVARAAMAALSESEQIKIAMSLSLAEARRTGEAEAQEVRDAVRATTSSHAACADVDMALEISKWSAAAESESRWEECAPPTALTQPPPQEALVGSLVDLSATEAPRVVATATGGRPAAPPAASTLQPLVSFDDTPAPSDADLLASMLGGGPPK